MKRKLTEEAKRAIRRSFYERIVKGIDVQAQARLFADHTCNLLELDDLETVGWWTLESRAPIGCPGGLHGSSVMGRRGDETVAICQKCGEVDTVRVESDNYPPPRDCLPPCPKCGVRLTEKNPYSGLCMFLHAQKCG